ncbi:protein FLC EXPRESSOR-like isoform X3 [Ipomoea triloba]|uniref:protein FLC EXPRESSOR-like isoform X3 n=1 Tax=Ipomoea triloba TaxID=35885 RepID=UPI00125E4238|nr:protein FLC EXPRESSOR-like isoform X3 [Ipomoea triloba]
MAGRNYLPPDALALRDGECHPLAIGDHRVIPRIPPPEAQARFRPAAILEDGIAVQHRHIQTLLLENQRFATTHVALKRQLAAAQQDLRQLTVVASAVKAECDAEVRGVYENSIRAEAEIRAVAELAQVKDGIEKMKADREELTAKLKEIEDELAMVRPELKQLKEIKTDIATMQKEIQRGRAAVEYEKKMKKINHEQSQIMEKNMMSMSCEIEKLRAELAIAENRARAVAAVAPTYPAGYGVPSTGYGGNMYPNSYAMQQFRFSLVLMMVPDMVEQITTRMPLMIRNNHISHRQVFVGLFAASRVLPAKIIRFCDGFERIAEQIEHCFCCCPPHESLKDLQQAKRSTLFVSSR